MIDIMIVVCNIHVRTYEYTSPDSDFFANLDLCAFAKERECSNVHVGRL